MQRDQRTYSIIGAAIEVHKVISPSYLEAVYHGCLEIEFERSNINFISKPKLEKYYVPDFLVFQEVTVKIKAGKCLTNVDEAQILNSLKISNHKVGLLINFGEVSLRFKRFVN